jgi:uncharacterized protein YbcI
MNQASSAASLSAAITGALVSIKKRRTGKGSPKAQTLVSNDFIVCIQKEGLTPVERSLREAGRPKEVKRLRDGLRERLRDDSVPMIEALTGRRVISFLSDYDIDEDIGVDCFVLEPNQKGRPESGTLHADPTVLLARDESLGSGRFDQKAEGAT